MNDFTETVEEIILCEATGKRCYNQREAGRILNLCKRHRSNDHLGRNKELPRRKYYCSDCGCYHLTKQPLYDRDSINHAWEIQFYREYERKENRKSKQSA